VEYDRLDIELAPSKVYTIAKPISRRGERFLRDRYIADKRGHVLLLSVGDFRRAADSMGLRVARLVEAARP
jgi:hypothetical protein